VGRGKVGFADDLLPSGGFDHLLGVNTPTAAATLSGMSLGIEVINVNSKTVPKGHIVSMSPAPGTNVGARSVITIENSIGASAG
jgi:beta-lactam-binding protein with PASTA domain